MFRYCKWCDHIRMKDPKLDEVIKDLDENGRIRYKLRFSEGDIKLYCYYTGKIIKNQEKETCSQYEVMDYAF